MKGFFMFGTSFASKLQPQNENKNMDYIIINQTQDITKVAVVEAIKDIEKALKSDKKYIVLNFDSNFFIQFNHYIVSPLT